MLFRSAGARSAAASGMTEASTIAAAAQALEAARQADAVRHAQLARDAQIARQAEAARVAEAARRSGSARGPGIAQVHEQFGTFMVVGGPTVGATDPASSAPREFNGPAGSATPTGRWNRVRFQAAPYVPPPDPDFGDVTAR